MKELVHIEGFAQAIYQAIYLSNKLSVYLTKYLISQCKITNKYGEKLHIIFNIYGILVPDWRPTTLGSVKSNFLSFNFFSPPG